MRLFVSCIGVHVRTMRKSRTIPVGVGALDDPFCFAVGHLIHRKRSPFPHWGRRKVERHGTSGRRGMFFGFALRNRRCSADEEKLMPVGRGLAPAVSLDECRRKRLVVSGIQNPLCAGMGANAGLRQSAKHVQSLKALEGFESGTMIPKQKSTPNGVLFCFGAPSGIRTRDPLIKSQLLYQLS